MITNKTISFWKSFEPLFTSFCDKHDMRLRYNKNSITMTLKNKVRFRIDLHESYIYWALIKVQSYDENHREWGMTVSIPWREPKERTLETLESALEAAKSKVIKKTAEEELFKEFGELQVNSYTEKVTYSFSPVISAEVVGVFKLEDKKLEQTTIDYSASQLIFHVMLGAAVLDTSLTEAESVRDSFHVRSIHVSYDHVNHRYAFASQNGKKLKMTSRYKNVSLDQSTGCLIKAAVENYARRILN